MLQKKCTYAPGYALGTGVAIKLHLCPGLCPGSIKIGQISLINTFDISDIKRVMRISRITFSAWVSFLKPSRITFSAWVSFLKPKFQKISPIRWKRFLLITEIFLITAPLAEYL